MVYKAMVPKPPRRLTRWLLKIQCVSSHKKISKTKYLLDIEVVMELESRKEDCFPSEGLRVPPPNAPTSKENEGMVSNRVSICKKKHIDEKGNFSLLVDVETMGTSTTIQKQQVEELHS